MGQMKQRKNQIEPIPQLEEWSKLDRAGIKTIIPKIKHKDGQQDGPTNVSQPFPSETNAAKSAAGSGR